VRAAEKKISRATIVVQYVSAGRVDVALMTTQDCA